MHLLNIENVYLLSVMKNENVPLILNNVYCVMFLCRLTLTGAVADSGDHVAKKYIAARNW